MHDLIEKLFNLKHDCDLDKDDCDYPQGVTGPAGPTGPQGKRGPRGPPGSSNGGGNGIVSVNPIVYTTPEVPDINFLVNVYNISSGTINLSSLNATNGKRLTLLNLQSVPTIVIDSRTGLSFNFVRAINLIYLDGSIVTGVTTGWYIYSL